MHLFHLCRRDSDSWCNEVHFGKLIRSHCNFSSAYHPSQHRRRSSREIKEIVQPPPSEGEMHPPKKVMFRFCFSRTLLFLFSYAVEMLLAVAVVAIAVSRKGFPSRVQCRGRLLQGENFFPLQHARKFVCWQPF